MQRSHWHGSRYAEKELHLATSTRLRNISVKDSNTAFLPHQDASKIKEIKGRDKKEMWKVSKDCMKQGKPLQT